MPQAANCAKCGENASFLSWDRNKKFAVFCHNSHDGEVNLVMRPHPSIEAAVEHWNAKQEKTRAAKNKAP